MSLLGSSAADPRERSTVPDPIHLWAKLTQGADDQGYHPVLCHLIDVAAVAHAIWREVLGPLEREFIAAAMGTGTEQAGNWIAFWAGLHDLGKISPAFQSQSETARQRVEAAGFPFPRPPRHAPHGTITTVTLKNALSLFGLPDNVIDNVRISIGGHHGRFPRPADQPDRLKSTGKGHWAAARTRVAADLAARFDITTEAAPPTQFPTTVAIWMAGLVSVADWIGSNSEFFPLYVHDPGVASRPPLAEYHLTARDSAERALLHLGWSGWAAPQSPRQFDALFPTIRVPHQVQRAVERLAPQGTGPSLVVIEAPMGEGKTEAALFLADYWSATSQTRGTYIALPTTATSNQMFARFREFLEHRFPGHRVNLQLLHGHAALSAEFQVLKEHGYRLFTPVQVFDEETDLALSADPARGAVVAAEWFTYRKRGLLATYGVGTIDQALLAVLQTRHYFVRLFGLSSKTVIIDEVHAYDSYMSTLLERLLEWLAVLGSPVVLLSATLPAQRRRDLLAAYARGLGQSPISVPEAAYPRISWVDRDSVRTQQVDASDQSTKHVRITWVPDDAEMPENPPSLGPRLSEALDAGGCAVVVCNTVRRAQETYLALLQHFPGVASDGGEMLDLLHARYLARDRGHRERRTLRRFGKIGGLVDGEMVVRPRRAVLVATQIVEQSLDLDFDLLVTDIAPVDLILQRMGRLHRHAGRERYALSEPAVWIRRPVDAEGTPRFDRGTAAVYETHILVRTWLTLADRDRIRIPDDVERLIAATYDDQPCPHDVSEGLQDLWNSTANELTAQRERDESFARNRRILSPISPNDLLGDRNLGLREEEDPSIHQEIQALTRLGDPTVNVVCLTREEQASFRRSAVPSVSQAAWFLQRSVGLGDRRIIRDLLDLPVPSGWQRSPLLRHHRLIELDGDGTCPIGQRRLRVDDALGVLIE